MEKQFSKSKITNKQSKTLLSKIIIPIIIILILQAVLYYGVFLNMFVLPETENSAFNILREQTANRSQFLESEMTRRWANLPNTNIVNNIERTLEENNATVKDIKTNPELNNKIIESVSSDIIFLLRKNSVTGAFIILDGKTLNDQHNENNFPGFYIRDYDPLGNNPENNQDVSMERGLPSLSKSLNLSLDNNWAASFNFSEGSKSDYDFFYKPLNVAKNNYTPKNKITDFGYWSESFQINEYEVPIITYSIPLISEDGTVFGVLGIDLTEPYLKNSLKYKEIDGLTAGSYILATVDENTHYNNNITAGNISKDSSGNTEDGNNNDESNVGKIEKNIINFKPVFINSKTYKSDLYKNDLHDEINNNMYLRGETMPENGMFKFKIKNETYYGNAQNLKLYNSTSPFSQENMVLIGLKPKNVLFAFSHKVTFFANIITILILIVGTIFAYFSSKIIIKPIQDVAKSITNVSPNGSINLAKTDIKEIDALTDSIENMSIKIAEGASRISRIIDMAKIPIGVFEYQRNSMVLCSERLFHIMGWTKYEDQKGYLTEEDFEKKLQDLKKHLYKDNKDIFKVPCDYSYQWIQLAVFKDDTNIFGTVTDITQEMEEKQRIEYERDYDSLTGVLNRRAFVSKAEKLFKQTKHEKIAKFSALIMCDVDNLKYVNDTYGHESGDHYIKALANKLIELEDYGNALIARRSGDEFIAFLYGYDKKEDAIERIESLWKTLENETITLPNGNIYALRASGGIAWFPDDAENIHDLIRYADFAMYSAKHSNKGELLEFNQREFADNAYLVSGQEALNRLLEDKEFTFALQPIISVHTESIYGYEFLLRSTLPEFNSPLDIIRMAISQSKTNQLETAIWFKAMETYIEKQNNGLMLETHKAFINSIGSVNLKKKEVKKLESMYKHHLENVVLELTESEKEYKNSSKRKKDVVKSFGGKLAIDDYGTGYNSQYRLLSLNPDIIKVDISIVQGIDSNLNKQTLFIDTVKYAKKQGIEVLAEGIETHSELETVIQLGADYLQGYYLGRPNFKPEDLDEKIVKEIRDSKNKNNNNPNQLHVL